MKKKKKKHHIFLKIIQKRTVITWSHVKTKGNTWESVLESETGTVRQTKNIERERERELYGQRLDK